MRLGFDLDDVVANNAAKIVEYLMNNFGIEWSIEHFSECRFDECTFSHDPELNKRIIKEMLVVANDADAQFLAEPIEGAQETLQKLKKDGHKIFFITSRLKRNQPNTFKWLRKHKVPFDNLDVIGHNQEKGFYGRKHNLDMFIDDQVFNLESMYRYKVKWRKGLLLFDRPWNMKPVDGTKFKRVYAWGEILRHIGIQNR